MHISGEDAHWGWPGDQGLSVAPHLGHICILGQAMLWAWGWWVNCWLACEGVSKDLGWSVLGVRDASGIGPAAGVSIMGVNPGESQLPLHLGSHKQKGLPGSDTFLPVNAPQPVHLLGGGSGTSRVKRPGRVVPLDSWAPHGCCLVQDAQRLSAKHRGDHCRGISSPFLGEATWSPLF